MQDKINRSAIERPIKKSERQIASPNDVVEEVLGTEPSAIEGSQGSITNRKNGHNPPTPETKQRKGKGNQQESEHSRQVNPALIRGPKPESKPPVIKRSQEASTEESVTEPVKRRLLRASSSSKNLLTNTSSPD